MKTLSSPPSPSASLAGPTSPSARRDPGPAAGRPAARRRKLGVTLSIVACSIFFAGTANATDPNRVEWSPDWPRVRLVEGLNVIAMTVGSIVISEHWQPPRKPAWEGGILFDDWLRDATRGRSASFQTAALDVGDILYKAGVLVPYILDAYVVTLGVHQNADVAIQMTLINMQSLGLSGVLALGTERSTARARPYMADCQPDGTTRDSAGRLGSNTCGGSPDYQSFYSGHAAAVATMAGLTCVHHQHLPLYGGGLADLAPCVVMIGAAVGAGASRMIGDRHYATDLIMGWGMGALSGYVLPSLLHYGFSGGRPIGEIRTSGMHMIPVPQVYLGGAGMAFSGVF